MLALKMAALDAAKAALADAMAELHQLRALVDGKISSTPRFSDTRERIAGRRDAPVHIAAERRTGTDE